MTSSTTVLFVCTGNIFRSMTAEYALRTALDSCAQFHVHSAGLIDAPHEVVPFVKEYLLGRGIDISGHEAKRLSREMLDGADLAVAMDIEHRRQIEEAFALRLPLFGEVAYDTESPLLDVYEVVPDWRNNEAAAKEYGWSVMDTIFDGMNGFVTRMDWFIRRGRA